MLQRTALLLPTAMLIVAAGGTAAVAALVARRVIHPHRAAPTAIVNVDGSDVILSRTALTEAAGVLGLLYDDERHLAVLQPHSAAPRSDGNIKRSLRAPVSPDLRPGLGRAVGNIFATPSDLGQTVRTVVLPTELGPAPAWLIGPDTGDTWLIHLHGSLSGREGALRSVAAASATGLPSLVPSFRGDGEGPAAPRGAFMLGQTEWRDIEPALDYALEHGAKRLVLLGWSNGASMALRLATSSRHREAIAGVVAISPVLDWASTIHLAAWAARLPRPIGALALSALQNPLASRLIGAPEPIRFANLRWTDPAFPVLLMHSAGDQTASYDDSVAFYNRNPDLVTMPHLDPAPHALEWNVNPEGFAHELEEWLARVTGVRTTQKVTT